MVQTNDDESDGHQSGASTGSETKQKTQVRMDLEQIQDTTKYNLMLSN